MQDTAAIMRAARFDFSGPIVRRLMRRHRKSIATLAREIGITQKRVRYIREQGSRCPFVARDWVQAITGTDPGPYINIPE